MSVFLDLHITSVLVGKRPRRCKIPVFSGKCEYNGTAERRRSWTGGHAGSDDRNEQRTKRWVESGTRFNEKRERRGEKKNRRHGGSTSSQSTADEKRKERVKSNQRSLSASLRAYSEETHSNTPQSRSVEQAHPSLNARPPHLPRAARLRPSSSRQRRASHRVVARAAEPRGWPACGVGVYT